MQNPIVEQIIQTIRKEDTFKLFTSNNSLNIINAISSLNENYTLYDLRISIISFFNKIIESSEPFQFPHTEAKRMLGIIEQIFSEIPKEYAQPPRRARDVNDELIDLYMDSIKNFAKDIDDTVLNQHIWYLDNYKN